MTTLLQWMHNWEKDLTPPSACDFWIQKPELRVTKGIDDMINLVIDPGTMLLTLKCL